MKQTRPSVPNRRMSPTCTFFAPRMKARQCEPSSRLCRVASIEGSLAPRPIRLPLSRAAITLLSLTTRQSPGSKRSGKSPTPRSSKSGAPPGRTTRSRAASRGLAGRSAMRSVGRSKSNRSVRIAFLYLPLQGGGRREAPGGGEHQGNPTPTAFGDRPSPFRGGIKSRPHRRLDDLVGVLDRLALLDLVDVFHALDHIAPGGVLVVEEVGVVEADEELAVAGIGAGRARAAPC